MLIDIQTRDNGIVIFNLSGDILRSSALRDLEQACLTLRAQGRRAIVLNLVRMRRVSLSGLAALIELVARQRETDIAFCALPDNIKRKLANSGLDRGLAIYENIEAALIAPQIRKHSLSRTKAVVLCAGKGTRVAPLSLDTPKPMLDILGRPVLHHLLQHLANFGIGEVVLNPGHLGPQIIDYMRNTLLPDQSVQFANEGSYHDGQWQSTPIGSASTLVRLDRQNSAFSEPFIVLCGDALIDLDLAEMMRQHIKNGVDVTMAAQTVSPEETHKYGMIVANDDGRISGFEEKPKPGMSTSTLANTGIYIFNPQVLKLLPDRDGLDIACDLLPAVLASGGTMQTFTPEFSWTDIGTISAYVQALRQGLRGTLSHITPVGKEIRTGVWCAPGAWISPRADITGPCYVGRDSIVDAGAKLTGPTIIGQSVLIEGRTLLSGCVVQDKTHVQKGAWAQNMILHGHWALSHIPNAVARSQATDSDPQNAEHIASDAIAQETSDETAAGDILAPMDRVVPLQVDNVLLAHRLA